MTPATVLAAPGPEGRSWTHVLLGAVRAEFRADVYVPDPGDRVLCPRPHRFRHTLGTRMINNEVSQPTVQRLLDHSSPAMTARYAHMKDQTLGREWERYQQRINVRGAISLDPDGPLSDAAWALENLARAKQTLPNGYCGLPLQQRCPHPNACLTCDNFLTTAEFLPMHRDQLERTDQLIVAAQAERQYAPGRDEQTGQGQPVADHRGPRTAQPGRRTRCRLSRFARQPSDAAAMPSPAAGRRSGELARRGEQATFQAVAREARVSRQWLYTHPELRAEIERIRATHAGQPGPCVPHAERASEASLRQRVESLLAENRRLRKDNHELRDELALAYGHQRDSPPGTSIDR